ncbi:MAG: sulfatase-like hydrolase/transferase [Rhizobiales bacterium]|nr:sulfatase-like hydrolase/transferase [Hyphomicrobiales bacterium]
MKTNLSPISAVVFLVHAAIMFVAHLENAALSSHLAFTDILPWQWTTLSASAACAILYEIMRRHRVGFWSFYVLFFLLLLALASNQFFYQVFQDSLTISHLDEFNVGDADNLAVSLRSEFGRYQFINLLLILFSAAALLLAERRWSNRSLLTVARVPAMLAGAALFLLSGLSLYLLQPDPQSPVGRATAYIALTVWRGLAPEQSADVASKDLILPPDLWQLHHGQPLDVTATASALSQARSYLQSRKRNVIMVVLESVGSRQLLRDGKPRPDLAPFLHDAAAHAVIFDSLANQYPGSTRAHVGMNTGGFIPTWSSVTSSLVYPYQGQTIISEYRKAGWATALYSSAYLKYENLKSFYDRLGFDMVVTADNPASGLEKDANPGGWGVDEYAVLQRAMTWASNAPKPFFLNYQTISTHHPYVVPPKYAAQFGGSDNLSKYESSIRFTDQLLRDLAGDVAHMGASEDTVLVVIGDHGEAFGDLHPDNFTHKNFLFEENIGNFLMIIDLGKTMPPAASHRRGTIADVMPTLIGMQGMKPHDGLVGQDLMSPGYQERLAFFFKSAYPEQWGVRDGQWKFIANRLEPEKFALYDLVADPGEKADIAGEYPERAALYGKLAANWYVYLDKSFRENLSLSADDNVPQVALGDVSKEGPVEIAIGSSIDPLPFRKLKEVNPDETLTVWTYGGVFKQDTPVDYIFTAPSGEEFRQTLVHKTDWVNVNYFAPLSRSREEGLWKVRLESAGKVLIQTEFKVSRSAQLIWSAFDTTPGVRFVRTALVFGDEFQVTNKINPQQDVSLLFGLMPLQADALHSAVVVAPDGSENVFSFNLLKGWKTSWVPVPAGTFSQTGTYRIDIYGNGTRIASTSLDVDEEATLMRNAGTN